MEMDLDMVEIKEFVKSEKFAQFLLNNTVNFSTCAFILQILFDKIEEIENQG